MENLFAEDNDVSDNESSLKTNNEYAKNYNGWRQREEFNKLKAKYGEYSLNSNDSNESDSSSEDDDDVDVSEKLEVDFFKTLSSLKTKDPKIYDANIKFFDDDPVDIKTKKKGKVEEMFLKDYERKLLLEKGGIVSGSDEDDDKPRCQSPTYIKEQRELKENLQLEVENIEDDNESEWGGMFKVRSKTKEEDEREESEYKQWLMGRKEHLSNSNTEKNLKPLKEYWNDPKLDKGEKFLRDYILHNRFLEKTNPDYVPTYDEVIHDSDNDLSEDEDNILKQDDFEHKYNYRFEEPDQDFIKRYPRTMENSIRRTDDRRKLKRAEVKERKVMEKEQKFEEIRKMKELMRKEIHEKIAKLREVTGNTTVAFENIDLETDFNAEDHDRNMQTLFNNEFYEGEEGDKKPEFPQMDEELEIERWDKWEGNYETTQGNEHCEDEDFNMDCDYDSTNAQKSSLQDELLDNSKGGRKKRKRKSKFAEAVSKPKPAFDPNDKSYDQYLEQYYKFDCEDIIGNIPCRFKYRNVVPNNFGLTVDEILSAKDRELNKWCSIKKAVQLRPDHVEKYDVIAYSNKGQNEALKRKILPSLFEISHVQDEVELMEDGKLQQPQESTRSIHQENQVKGKQKKNKKKVVNTPQQNITNQRKREKLSNENIKGDLESLKKNKDVAIDISESVIRKKRRKLSQENIESKEEINFVSVNKKKKKEKNSSSNLPTEEIIESIKYIKKSIRNCLQNKKNKSCKLDGPGLNKCKNNKSGAEVEISDARLKAFGIKPKKFKKSAKFCKIT